MGEFSTVGDISQAKPNISGRPDPTEPLNYFQDVRDVGAGWADENIFGLAFKYIVDASVAQDDTEFVTDKTYNIFFDRQLKGLEPYIGNFLHSKSKKHTSKLIKDFIEDSKKANGSPSYIVGRVLGGLTDPSSLFMFTKAGSFMFTGTRLMRSGKVGGLITTEEMVKQGLSTTRTWEETALISASGFILPALFPAINNKLAGKQFDDTASKLDNMDTHYSNSQYVGGGIYKEGSVGAGATQPIRTEAEWIKANQIKPTGMGYLGEKSGFTPLFRVLDKGGLEEQDFITTVLENPLLTKGNFEGVPSAPTIERKIKSRHYMIKISDDAVMSEYNAYLKRLGKNEQKFLEKVVNTKIGTGLDKTGVMTPREFSSAVTRARLNPDAPAIPEVKAAAKHTEDLFYAPLGKEYQESGISIAWHKYQIDRLDMFIKQMDGSIEGRKAVTNKKKLQKLEDLIVLRRKLKAKLTLMETKGIHLRKNYINPLYKRDAIDANPELFKQIMREELEKLAARNPSLLKKSPNMTKAQEEAWMMKNGNSPDIIDDIIESFMQYQPTLRLRQIDDVLNEIPEEALGEVNKISSRFLGRDLNIDYTRLMKEGFMEDDIMLLQRHYFNQVVPDIELTKVFGDPMGYGTRWSPDNSYQQGIIQISDEMLRKNKKYDMYYNQRFDENALPLSSFLTKQQIKNLQDIDASIHLVRGTYGLPYDPNRTFSRGLRMMKLYNATTMLTGIAQVVDTARLVMINGMTKTFKIQTEMFQSGMAKEILKMSKNSTQLGGEALDMIDS